MKITKTKRILLATLLALAFGQFSFAQDNEDPQVSPYAEATGWEETKTERMEWFKDAKFGMFIHWGLYAPAGGYWPPDQ